MTTLEKRLCYKGPKNVINLADVEFYDDEVEKQLKKWDTNGNGEITVDELILAVTKQEKLQSQKRYLTIGIIIAVLTLVFVSLSLLGVSIAAIELTKESQVKNNIYVSTNDGKPIVSGTPTIDGSSFNIATTEGKLSSKL